MTRLTEQVRNAAWTLSVGDANLFEVSGSARGSIKIRIGTKTGALNPYKTMIYRLHSQNAPAIASFMLPSMPTYWDAE